MARKNPLLELLNRLLRLPPETCTDLEVEVLHRGAGGDRRKLGRTELVAIHRRGLLLADGTVLPPHRIRAVRRGGEQLWAAKKKSGEADDLAAARGK